MILLVDQDGVLSDLEAKFWPIFGARYPDAPKIAPEDRTTFYVEDQIGQEWRKYAEPILHEKGFFQTLPIVPGALEGLLRLSKEFEVYICTSPVTSPWCATEKLLWIKANLGPKWARRTIITKDKTLVRGEYLIDDRPEVKGDLLPQWEHIHFDRPYNRGLSNRRIMDWYQILDGGFAF